ncbi:MAG: hypothetical protein K1X75_02320 [Leptospirales bacterium]|nr:hypothetical protein [Leptospirales bacterium]
MLRFRSRAPEISAPLRQGTLLVCLFFAACQSARWPLQARIDYRGFRLAAVDGATEEQLQAVGALADRASLELENCCFGQVERPRILVFRDLARYRSGDRAGLESLARYHPGRDELHLLSPVLSIALLRHELSHVYLYRRRQDAPYWLQEGLALWLQEGAARWEHDCVAERRDVPDQLRSYLTSLRAEPPPDWASFARPARWSAMAAVRSVYFIKFLFQERRLARLVRLYLHGEDDMEALIGRDSLELQLQRFRQWLQQPAAALTAAGC